MRHETLEQCRFPALKEPYDAALREAVAHILSRFDVVGLIASGTIIRGNPRPSSDLDLYVIHLAPFRQRIQRTFNGVPAEIFVNPPGQVRHYFEDEQRHARPITAHMLASGFVVLDRDLVVEQLRQEAREYLSTRPTATDDQLRWTRYLIATQIEDALDMADDDPITGGLIAGEAVVQMLRYRFRQANQFVPRDKDLLGAMDKLDSTLAELARGFYGAGDVAARLAFLTEIAARTVGVTGFFDWESEPEAVGD